MKEHYARGALDCPRRRPRRQRQSHPRGFRRGRGPVLELPLDPWTGNNRRLQKTGPNIYPNIV